MLASAAVLVLFPFVWIAAAAFKTQIALVMGQVTFTPTLANFRELLFSISSDYLANFVNSLIVAGGSTAIVLVASTLAAYSIDRMGWPRWMVHSFLLFAAVFNAIPADHDGRRLVRDVSRRSGSTTTYRGPDPRARHAQPADRASG